MRNFWTILFLAVPVLGTAGFVAAWFSGSAWLPTNISATGDDIDLLFYVILILTGVFFVLTEALLVWAMFQGRGKANGKGRFFHGHLGLEVGWTLVTAVLLLILAFGQMPAWAKAKYRSHKPEKDLDAFIYASQFLWEARHPLWDFKANRPRKIDEKNPSLTDTFTLNNELHVPPTDAANSGKNDQVLVHITTRDVIHSFWLPNMRIKQDALPGHVIPVWFDARNASGEDKTYEWVCAELCGWGHYRMRAKVVVHKSKEDYNKWLQDQTKEITEGKVK